MATVIVSGLTRAHETLLEGLFGFLGQDVVRLPEPDGEALKIGRIYCNRGQCNPVYYTAGNLIRFLQGLRASGEKDIEKNYYYLTAGACGPCRFGMYEIEYRKALHDAGFPGFKVVGVQQNEALVQDLRNLGFRFEKRHLSRFINAIILADLLNNLYYKIKPYEVMPESVDRWRNSALDLLYAVFRYNSSITPSLKQICDALGSLKLDYLSPKPKVKIIGEIFSHLHEGDASYGLPSWLVEEGAEPVVEPLSNWLEYLFWEKIQFTRDRAFRGRVKALREILPAWLLKTSIHLHFAYFRFILNNRPDKLARQRQLARYAAPYYHVRLIGGEGHMEAGKHIYAVRKHQAHMVISIKPFSCMPSTQSDGVQTKIAEDMKGSLFVSVDTTGDAEVNVKSRILMKLQVAQKRAESEFREVLERKKLTEARLKVLRERARLQSLPMRNRRRRYIATATRVLATLV